MFFRGGFALITIRPAGESDIPEIKKIADANKRYLGFTKGVILVASIAKTELHVAVLEKRIVGFIRWHKRRDDWITVYELCVDETYRKQGIGRKLMDAIGNGLVKLKCHFDNPAMQFYKRLGFKVVSSEITKGGKKLDFLTRNNHAD